MKEMRAAAEIRVDPGTGWRLPAFGSKKPNQFRYWAHVHFKNDATWGSQTWTLLIDLNREPVDRITSYEAVVYFMSPHAPHNLLKKGAKFELVCGESHYGEGSIIEVLE